MNSAAATTWRGRWWCATSVQWNIIPQSIRKQWKDFFSFSFLLISSPFLAWNYFWKTQKHKTLVKIKIVNITINKSHHSIRTTSCDHETNKYLSLFLLCDCWQSVFLMQRSKYHQHMSSNQEFVIHFFNLSNLNNLVGFRFKTHSVCNNKQVKPTTVSLERFADKTDTCQGEMLTTGIPLWFISPIAIGRRTPKTLDCAAAAVTSFLLRQWRQFNECFGSFAL